MLGSCSLEQQMMIGRNAAHPQTIDPTVIPDPLIIFRQQSHAEVANHANEVPDHKTH